MASLETIQDLRITRFIAHIADHWASSLKHSSLETPVDDKFPRELFEGYILRALKDDQRRRARFRAQSAVREALPAVAEQPEMFVEVSKTVASHLYGVMDESRYRQQIKPGDIMVALFQDAAAAGPEDPVYLAILKIDLSDAVIRRVLPGKGQQQVVYEKRDDRIPRVEENKIQKIAVVSDRLIDEPEPHDVILLDNNIKEVGIAHFFYDDFLQADLCRNPLEVTRVLVGGLKRFMAQKSGVVSPPLAPREQLVMLRAADEALRPGTPVVVDELAERVVRSLDRPAADKRTISTALLDDYAVRPRPEDRMQAGESVPVDAQEAERQKTLTLLLDGGLQIKGNADQVWERVEISPEDADGTITITIRTRKLDFR